MPQRPYPQPELHMGLVIVYLFRSCWPINVQFCVSRSRNSVNGNRQVEVFLYLSRSNVLENGVFYLIFEHICKKICFRFFF